jgi:hypothetical protein
LQIRLFTLDPTIKFDADLDLNFLHGSGSSSKQCCGSGIFTPDPGSEFFHPEFRIRECKYIFLTQKIVSKLSGNMIQEVHPGSKFRIPVPDIDFLRIPDPVVKKTANSGSTRPQHCKSAMQAFRPLPGFLS